MVEERDDEIPIYGQSTTLLTLKVHRGGPMVDIGGFKQFLDGAPGCDDFVCVETSTVLTEILLICTEVFRVVEMFLDHSVRGEYGSSTMPDEPEFDGGAINGEEENEISREVENETEDKDEDEDEDDNNYNDFDCWDIDHEMLDDEVVVNDETEKHLVRFGKSKENAPMIVEPNESRDEINICNDEDGIKLTRR
ncbi:hypothetical protein PanWU01x14_077430 [Parasponia andersonii]|uniref:Uncharacterized protein n=1 Tax=Parasponia andersonii TaxID=3476 RepID=A0A2P5DBQ5_PARAD|nr:hypothetical protein PanWU01x14_077430 [Parasponia andersonii]